MKSIYILVLLVFLSISCTKITDDHRPAYLSGKGVFVLNEGNFTWGNGSLSLYSYDSTKIYNNLFQDINGRPLGDVPNAIIPGRLKLLTIAPSSHWLQSMD
jgi:hypothetical protein